MKNKIFILFFLIMTFVFGQNVKVVKDNSNDLRLKYIEAIRFENQKQPEKALENYRYLFQSMPEEKLFYNRYFDLLFQLKKYDELENVLSKTIKNNPINEKAKIDLGKLYYIKDDTTEAKKIWDTYLKESNYSKIFSQHLFYTMISLRMRTEAEAILLKSREINKNDNLFSKDLGDYYFSSGSYIKSTKEYLKYLKEDDRNYNYIADMILQFPKNETVLQKVDSVLVSSINKKDDINVHKIRSDYLFVNKSYDKAAIEIFYLEKKTGYSGANVLEFCANLISQKEYEYAKKIYSQVLKQKELNSILTETLLGLARVEEQLILEEYTNSPLNLFFPGNQFFNTNFVYINEDQNTHLSRAFAIYDSLSTINKDENISGQAEFNIANLRNYYLRDFDGAIKNYDLAEKKSKSVRFKHKCFNNKLQALISKGELQKASDLLEKRKKQFHKNFDKDYLVNRILLDFLNQDFDKVKNAKDDVIKILGFDHPAFNDYFELLNFIDINFTKKSEDEQKDFKRFVTAELMLKQNKLGEAIGILNFTLASGTESPITDDALLRIIQINLLIEKDEAAEVYAYRLMKIDSINRDIAAKMLGDYYFSKQMNENAKKWYQTILLDFPNSFYIETARNRLREIRGDNLR